MSLELKVKIKSLAEAARIIRKEECKLDWKTDQAKRFKLFIHRTVDIRIEARATLLAYAYLRGREYLSVEPTAS